ncbi:MAG: hypothetical protein WA624_19410, partial [Methylocella sp.]
SCLIGVVGFLGDTAHGKSPTIPSAGERVTGIILALHAARTAWATVRRRLGRTVGRGDRWEASTLDERPAMMIQLTVFFPAVIAIYAATGAWVYSCDPISKTVDIVRGGLLYGWIGVLFMCARVLVFPY